MTERITNLRKLLFEKTHVDYRIETLNLSILDEKTMNIPFGVRKAMAFRLALEKMPVFLQEGELIVGGKTLYSLPAYITEYEKKIGNPNIETQGYNNAFDTCYNLGQDERGYGIADSSIPAYYKFVPMGLPAIIEQARIKQALTPDKQAIDYYESVIVAYTAAIQLIKRYENLVKEAMNKEQTEIRRTELETIAKNLAQLQTGAPKTYWQAVQLMYFMQFLIWVEGGYLVPLGRTDQILYPFYKKDIDAGNLDKEFAYEILECFFIKLNYEIDRTHGESGKFNSDTGQSITIGGVNPRTGKDATNELTFMILDAKCDTLITDPKVHLRVHKDTPDAIWQKAAYLNSLGMGFPTYENDEAIIPAFMNQGCYTLEDARDYSASGCWELIIQGRSYNRNLGMIDCLRSLEWALNDGQYFLGVPDADTAVGLIDGKFGLDTGKVEQFDTYDKLFNAFKVQIKHAIDMTSSYCNRSWNSPSPFYSSLIEDCLEKGRDFDGAGCRYTETDFQLSSLSNAADALYTIRKLVYTDHEYTLKDLSEILKSNWQGQEQLRQRVLNELPKFGNDCDEVDSIATTIVDYYTREVTKHRNSFNGPYRARISSALGYICLSQNLGASADGRLARSFYADNLSPQIGADKEGPTGIVSSCGKLNYSNCSGGAVLDMKFHPSALKTTEGRAKFASLIKTYFSLGGEQIQINVLDNKVLLDAKRHPENYRDLMVRIWGFSTYFTAIPEVYQDHIIARSVLNF